MAFETPEEAARRATARMVLSIRQARSDPNAYIEFVGQTPTGERIRQAQFHRELQEQFGRERSVTHAAVYLGKTVGVMHRLVWETGHDQNITINYVSATTQHPQNVHRAWQTEITDNPRVKLVFPGLKKGIVWSVSKSQVERSSRDPSPTFRVFGAFSKSMPGARAKLTVFDDLVNFENSFTEYARDKMAEWIGEAFGRGTRDNRVIFVGNMYRDDQLSREAKKVGVSYRRYEATLPDRDDGLAAWQTEAGDPDPAMVEALGEDGEPIPTSPSTMDIVTLRKREADLGPILAELMLRCRVPSMSMGRFSKRAFEKCLRRGRGLDFMAELRGHGALTYTGVDLGHTKKPGADYTVIITALAYPDGGDRRIIDIRSGRWNGTEIRDEVVKVKEAFHSNVFVESNGGQQLLIDVINEIEAVRPHHTGRNKHDIVNGVESLALEMDQGRWILPCSENEVPNEEVGKLIRGCMRYDPSKPAEHTDDWLMALWILREGIRTSLAANLGGGFALPGRHEMHGLMDR